MNDASISSRRNSLPNMSDGSRDDRIFFAAVEKTRMPMVVTDPNRADNPIIFANAAFIDMTGYGADEIIGNNCRFLQGPETDAGELMEIRKAVAEQRDHATEILNYRKNGTSFWNALFISPVFDADNNLLFFFGSQLDVSRRRDAEDALRQAQKMEAVGQLTGGIAHDFNNLLQVMQGYLELSINQVNRGTINRDKLAQNLENTQNAARRASTLTQQLLAFSRKQRLEGRSVNLNEIVDRITELTQRTLGAGVEIRKVPDARLWNCKVDPGQCEMALLNVIFNARDAMEGRPEKVLTIETRNVVVGEEDTQNFAGLTPGRYAALAITDTGRGIPAEMRHRVLDPFFTTKEEGKGTGLGLSMVYGFTKQSGGSVRVYSEENVGTTIRLYFPKADAGADWRAPSARPGGEQGGNETVLVVEDRLEVGDLAEAFLAELGYTVLRAADGHEAMDMLRRHENVALLFSDLIMPGGMNGVVLARHARRLRPRLSILLTTGYAEASIERVDAGGDEFEIINKPYRQVELARKVRQVIEGPNGVT